MNVEKLIQDIKNAPDINPDQYDGSYELTQTIVKFYDQMTDLSELDYKDLNAVYHMTIGTWRQSVEKKKESVDATHLPEDSKSQMKDLLDSVWDKACLGKYDHKKDNVQGKIEDYQGKPIIGMFGTGFFSFRNTSPEETTSFIKMCCDIEKLDNDAEIYARCEKTLSNPITGMAAASLSMILHCLKPYTFPILNGNYVGETIFPVLGIKLRKSTDTKTYIQNCRNIKEFRDGKTGIKNYRVFDIFSMNLQEYIENEIDIGKLKEAIDAYKKDFPQVVNEENYKWTAVKTFQDNFDIESADFPLMLKEATKDANNLLDRGGYYLPRAVILDIAKYNPEYTREMFRNLYDESVGLTQRILKFEEDANIYYEIFDNPKLKTFQNQNAITVYLFFRFPEKYYMYMPEKFVKTAKFLKYGEISKGGSSQRVEEYFRMADQIWDYCKTDQELIDLNRSRLTEDCYEDSENHILAEDIVYYIYRHFEELEGHIPKGADDLYNYNNDGYWPSYDEYPLELSKEEWKQYIEEVEIPKHKTCARMLKGLLEAGGEASPKQLSDLYGGSPYSYVGCAVNIGRRAKDYFDLEPCMDGDQERFFPIPFLGRSVELNGKSFYSYKLRPELYEALKETDLSSVNLSVAAEENTEESANYWLYAPGRRASEWNNCVEQGVMLLGWNEIGDLSNYQSRDEIVSAMKEVYGDVSQYWMNSLSTWQFSHVIKPGDVVFAKKGRNTLVGRGVVTSEYYYEQERGQFPNVLDVKWTHVGEWAHPGLAQVKTLTQIDRHSDYAQKLDDIFSSVNEQPEQYTDNDFLNEVFISEERLQEMKELLEIKHNIILQGAPGVGKTFTAKRLAYAIMGIKSDSTIQFVQFHQNYSYEDFIMGYKPTDDGGFEMQEGVFYAFCKSAELSKKKHFFIIDEINRGNLSKIFGELLMAIESDYRTHTIRLAYSDELFSVPENVYIIGMMNTADRSLALIDYALRRRFSFVPMYPGFDTDGFVKYQKSLQNEIFDNLIQVVKDLNEDIRKDESLGEGFCLGHSYFCKLTKETCTKSRLRQIVRYDLIPTLEEYWFDDKEKLKLWKRKLKEIVE